MLTIHALPTDVITKIAAGEVIERPASALKELIENSLDAKASEILITIADSGLSKIEVQDNGIGMSKEDLEECFKPHTTSKLKTEDDLRRIKTLGFRGEALASMASVSTVEIKSRMPRNTLGHSIEVMNGRLIKSARIGMGVGTTVSVSRLFETLPARKKFLKSNQTEFRRIVDVVTQFALSHAKIGFTLIHNEKEILHFTQGDSLEDRISSVLGPSLLAHLLPINVEESYVAVRGFIGRPQAASGAQKQFLFINSRSISDSIISSALKEAYGSLLEPTSVPVAVLFLELPPELVDVNVHPKKDRIHFEDPELLFQTIRQFAGQTLSDHNLTYANMSWTTRKQTPRSIRKGSVDTPLAKTLKQEIETWNPRDFQMDKDQEILQIHFLYLVTETDHGFLIIDQHAAHERILYNQFEKALKEKQEQNIVLPVIPSLLMDLSPSDILVFEECKAHFDHLGFDIEVFDSNTLRVNSIPMLSKGVDIRLLIVEMIEELVKESGPSSHSQRLHRMLSYLACKSAIKAGDKLSLKERRSLLDKLSKEDMAYTCPHGRPVKIEVNLEDLHKLFKRK